MKKLFLSLVALAVAAMSYAQSSMLATLSHNGNIKMFYGVSALKSAYNAAVNGDIITLSSGSFNAVDIAKGLTIRGAGMGIDSLSNSEPTVIVGDFKINIPSTVTKRLTLEGIYHNHKITVSSEFKNGTFLKCRFNEIDSYDKLITNLTMIHCKVAYRLYTGGESNGSFVNSIINEIDGYYHNSYDFLNCVVHNKVFSEQSLGASSFKNCVLVCPEEWTITASGVVYNCIGISNNKKFFEDIPNTTNVVKTYAEVFKTYRGTYSDNETFELTETAKTKYQGIDGTQVGIYGGNMPFDPIPSNPQITKCNVAAKSTADGKLSVDIEVNGAE